MLYVCTFFQTKVMTSQGPVTSLYNILSIFFSGFEIGGVWTFAEPCIPVLLLSSRHFRAKTNLKTEGSFFKHVLP